MAAGVLLVSIPKGGTHLVAQALTRFGYVDCGVASIRDDDTRRQMVAQLKLPSSLTALTGPLWYLDKSKIGYWLVAEVMSRVLRPDAVRLSSLKVLTDTPPLARELTSLKNEDLFPPNLLVSCHELWHDDYSSRFLQDWTISGHPKIVFVYRDPRDQLLSLIHFLRDSPVAGTIGALYAPILRRFACLDEQIAYAIQCPTFPFRHCYREHAWMLGHPNILKIRFEDCVGDRGGGNDDQQLTVLRELASFVDADTEVGRLAPELFGGTKTFRVGRINQWSDGFSASNRRLFNETFGDVLELYGYA